MLRIYDEQDPIIFVQFDLNYMVDDEKEAH